MKWLRVLAVALLPAALAIPAQRRIVIIKEDGVPADLMYQVLAERDPHTGHSRLPWIEQVFSRHGARVENFFVRGISLSAPSWAMLDTGYHQRIHGNVEYDRITLRPYDYLNFFPFYLGNAAGRQADMPGVQVLDASGVPLIVDRFPWDQRYQSFQLYQRWIHWKTLQHSLQNRFTLRSPRELLDEWVTGFDFSSSITEQTEHELIAHLRDPHYLYLDYFSGEFDHTAHLNNSRPAQIDELQHIDALIGRVWTAIRNSPHADQTLLAMVSDHGMNSTEGVYSQGYSLVNWFTSGEGGGHHTATDRYPLDQYKLSGLNPIVSEVITPSPDSSYLKDQAHDYPTVFLDLDGNERAAVQLRNSDLNALHILLQQLSRKDLPPHLRVAASATFFEILDADRPRWKQSLTELSGELEALHRSILRERAFEENQPKHKWTKAELEQGLEQNERRRAVRLESWEHSERSYTEYERIMHNLLELKPGTLEPSRIHIDDLIPKRSLGEPNTLFDLQNYVVRTLPGGFDPDYQRTNSGCRGELSPHRLLPCPAVHHGPEQRTKPGGSTASRFRGRASAPPGYRGSGLAVFRRRSPGTRHGPAESGRTTRTALPSGGCPARRQRWFDHLVGRSVQGRLAAADLGGSPTPPSGWSQPGGLAPGLAHRS